MQRGSRIATSPLLFFGERIMIETTLLSPRLAHAATFIREGAFLADVGTDHAYLPIALCLGGHIRGAVASDVNRGPIERAEENIKKYSLENKISLCHCDGLCGIERFSPTDISILGMGGELIVKILSAAPWTKNGSIRLCLQPMTHAEILRAYLAAEGYTVVDESIAVEDDKIYQLISAEYTGAHDIYTDAELLLGKINIRRKAPELTRLAEHHIAVLTRRIDGKTSAGASADDEQILIDEIKKVL